MCRGADILRVVKSSSEISLETGIGRGEQKGGSVGTSSSVSRRCRCVVDVEDEEERRSGIIEYVLWKRPQGQRSTGFDMVMPMVCGLCNSSVSSKARGERSREPEAGSGTGRI